MAGGPLVVYGAARARHQDDRLALQIVKALDEMIERSQVLLHRPRIALRGRGRDRPCQVRDPVGLPQGERACPIARQERLLAREADGR